MAYCCQALSTWISTRLQARQGKLSSKALDKALLQLPTHALSFVRALLHVDPSGRMSVDTALQHPFLHLWSTLQMGSLQGLRQYFAVSVAPSLNTMDCVHQSNYQGLFRFQIWHIWHEELSSSNQIMLSSYMFLLNTVLQKVLEICLASPNSPSAATGLGALKHPFLKSWTDGMKDLTGSSIRTTWIDETFFLLLSCALSFSMPKGYPLSLFRCGRNFLFETQKIIFEIFPAPLNSHLHHFGQEIYEFSCRYFIQKWNVFLLYFSLNSKRHVKHEAGGTNQKSLNRFFNRMKHSHSNLKRNGRCWNKKS